jgi:hypothetical protein
MAFVAADVVTAFSSRLGMFAFHLNNKRREETTREAPTFSRSANTLALFAFRVLSGSGHLPSGKCLLK